MSVSACSSTLQTLVKPDWNKEFRVQSVLSVCWWFWCTEKKTKLWFICKNLAKIDADSQWIMKMQNHSPGWGEECPMPIWSGEKYKIHLERNKPTIVDEAVLYANQMKIAFGNKSSRVFKCSKICFLQSQKEQQNFIFSFVAKSVLPMVNLGHSNCLHFHIKSLSYMWKSHNVTPDISHFGGLKNEICLGASWTVNLPLAYA